MGEEEVGDAGSGEVGMRGGGAEGESSRRRMEFGVQRVIKYVHRTHLIVCMLLVRAFLSQS